MSNAGISDFLLSTGQPDDIAVVDGAASHSYTELRAAVDCIVAVLRDAEVTPGARIGVLGPNSFFWIAAYLAAMKIGTAVPLSEGAVPEDLGTQLDWVECWTVLVDRRSLRRFGEALRDRDMVTDAVLADDRGENAEEGSDTAETAIDPDSDAVLMFTSGTTARPKAVRVTHGNLRANTASILEYLGLGRTDRTLVILPFHYCFGASLLHTQLAVGGRVVLCNNFVFPQSALELLEREACTVLAGVPSTFQLLLRASNYSSHLRPSLRLVQQAGGRMAPSSIKALAAAQPQSRLFVMYGQTEATARLSYLPPDRLADKLGSIGRGIPGVELSVVDEADRRVAPGEQGEIVARGASISPGYHLDPQETARKFRGGALRTGDLATVDEDGFIYIVGRSETFIKSWGHRISPQQIEEAALTHPGVIDAAAVGLSDPDAGERIVLAVVGTASTQADVQELLAYLRKRLPKQMMPQAVVNLDALPLSANGKVALPELRSRLMAAEYDIAAGRT